MDPYEGIMDDGTSDEEISDEYRGIGDNYKLLIGEVLIFATGIPVLAGLSLESRLLTLSLVNTKEELLLAESNLKNFVLLAFLYIAGCFVFFWEKHNKKSAFLFAVVAIPLAYYIWNRQREVFVIIEQKLNIVLPTIPIRPSEEI